MGDRDDPLAALKQLDDDGVDLPRAERPGHGHAMVAVAHEEEVADPVQRDRRQRLAAPLRGRDPLPARAQPRRRRPEAAVEVGGAEAAEQPAVLRAQTERLLSDPKAKRFVNAFLDYWLDLRLSDGFEDALATQRDILDGKAIFPPTLQWLLSPRIVDPGPRAAR